MHSISLELREYANLIASEDPLKKDKKRKLRYRKHYIEIKYDAVRDEDRDVVGNFTYKSKYISLNNKNIFDTNMSFINVMLIHFVPRYKR
jgi:hypothetical protein